MVLAKSYDDLKTELYNSVYDKSVGFVPTMGALHIGHLSLIDRAISENDVVVCSIFVNPTQFNNPDDFKKYPRDLRKDLDLLSIYPNLIVFAPESPQEVYNNLYTPVMPDLAGLDILMEGAFRPGHFEGVVNVVNQLFKLVKPTRAYFGEKDYQQLAIIRQMVRDLGLSIEVIGCPTLREPNGLAFSSRNERLQANERRDARIIFESLNLIRKNYPVYSLTTCLEIAINNINADKRADVEYLVACDSEKLHLLKEWHDSDQITICTAVHFSGIRLIDNISFTGI